MGFETPTPPEAETQKPEARLEEIYEGTGCRKGVYVFFVHKGLFLSPKAFLANLHFGTSFVQ